MCLTSTSWGPGGCGCGPPSCGSLPCGMPQSALHASVSYTYGAYGTITGSGSLPFTGQALADNCSWNAAGSGYSSGFACTSSTGFGRPEARVWIYSASAGCWTYYVQFADSGTGSVLGTFYLRYPATCGTSTMSLTYTCSPLSLSLTAVNLSVTITL